MTTPFQVGQTYYGPGNQRVHVLAIDERQDQAVVQWPISGKVEAWSLARLGAHAAGSPWRTYSADGPAGPERLTRMTVADDGTVRVKDERTRQEYELSAEEWAGWLDNRSASGRQPWAALRSQAAIRGMGGRPGKGPKPRE